MATISAKASEVERKWFVVDASEYTLGRLASKVATVLRGKNKAIFTPHADTGDFVVVINADKIKLTGSKLDNKLYQRHSGIPGGFKETPYRVLLAKHPELVIDKAVRGMLPKNSLGRRMRSKLKVYAGPTHPHSAQKPEALAL